MQGELASFPGKKWGGQVLLKGPWPHSQALTAFLHCERWKAGQGLGTRLYKGATEN